jgi:RNA polymerase sigma-70 factor, ECF subfamily
MNADQWKDISRLFAEVRAGLPGAEEQLLQALYDELRRWAGGMMRRERPDHTLQPSALVNEAVIRLLQDKPLTEAPNGRYLFAAAAEIMRRILIEHDRRGRARRHGGGLVRVPLDEDLVAFEEQGLDVLALHEALDRLAQVLPRQAELVKLRYFGGCSVPEVAKLLGVSRTTAEKDWRFAQAWLKGQLGDSER